MAHLVLKMVRQAYPKTKVFVFARMDKERNFARELGAVWAGGIEEQCPENLGRPPSTPPRPGSPS